MGIDGKDGAIFSRILQFDMSSESRLESMSEKTCDGQHIVIV